MIDIISSPMTYSYEIGEYRSKDDNVDIWVGYLVETSLENQFICAWRFLNPKLLLHNYDHLAFSHL